MLIPVYEAPLLPFFYFPKSLHSQVGKKVFFPTFFPGFLEWAFHPGLILKTFSKGKKIIFSLFFCNIVHLWGISFPQHFVPKDPDFFLSPQTFSFASMKSLVFKIVLPGSQQLHWNEPSSTILKTRDFISAKQKVFGDKKPGSLFGTKFFAKTDFPHRRVYVTERERKT